MQVRTDNVLSSLPVFRFSLKSLFIVVSVLPLLAAAWAGVFGDFMRFFAFQLALLSVFGILWFFTVHIPASARFRQIQESGVALAEEQDTAIADRIAKLEARVSAARHTERTAQARYDAAAGPLEDVIHARAMRLKAEIDLIRCTC